MHRLNAKACWGMQSRLFLESQTELSQRSRAVHSCFRWSRESRQPPNSLASTLSNSRSAQLATGLLLRSTKLSPCTVWAITVAATSPLIVELVIVHRMVLEPLADIYVSSHGKCVFVTIRVSTNVACSLLFRPRGIIHKGTKEEPSLLQTVSTEIRS